ncbi:MAG TPA: hypothetical protein VFE05_02805 [Longimicrobiaceae bacterium]|jgi:hypothetical protein|nr:hypothetical protein [Longimicrobiaceae bacterium]
MRIRFAALALAGALAACGQSPTAPDPRVLHAQRAPGTVMQGGGALAAISTPPRDTVPAPAGQQKLDGVLGLIR